MNIKAKIKQLSAGKNTVYANIADFLLNYEEFQHLKIKHVMEACHVSSSSVVRFCQELGFRGFSEMKFALINDFEYRSYDYLKHFGVSGDIDNHLEAIMVSFEKTRKMLSMEKLINIIEQIRNSQEIQVWGLGTSYVVSLDFEMRFSRLKKYVKAADDINLQYFAAKNASQDTLVIGICYSGATRDIIENMRVAKEEGAKTIIFTNEKNRFFEEIFDIVVYIYTSEPTQSRVSTASRLTMLYIVDLIYFEYIDKFKEETKMILNHNSKPF